MENTYNYLIEDKFHAMTTKNQPQIAGWCSFLTADYSCFNRRLLIAFLPQIILFLTADLTD